MNKQEIKSIANDELLLYYARLLGSANASEKEFKKVETEILTRMAVNSSVVVNNLCKSKI